MIAAIQHRELVPRRLVLIGEMRDRAGHAFGLVVGVTAFDDADRRSFALFAPEFLFVQVRIVRNQCIRRAQNASPAAVILFETDNPERRIVARKFGKIFRIRTTPRIDALIVVTHCGERTAGAG